MYYSWICEALSAVPAMQLPSFNMAHVLWIFLSLSAILNPSSASCSSDLEEKLQTYNCTCDQDTKNDVSSFVRCKNTNLTSIPNDLPDTPPLHGLHMEGNSMNFLSEIPYPNLEMIILSNNNIKCISKGVFSNLANVETMVLSNNSFLLEPNTFQGMHSLKILTLDGNPLYELVNLTFSGNTTSSLQHLSLANCRIFAADSLAFHNMQELMVLNISHNRLTHTVKVDNALSLNTLDLSYNKIADLSDLPFDGLQKVEHLHLDHNMITSLSASVFHGLDNLKSLSVSSNQLADISPSTFDSLTILKDLRLDHNELQSLTLSEDQMSSLESVKVHHNRWRCDCDTGWMRDHERVKEFNPPEQMRCDSPVDVSGQSLYEVDIHKFDCPDPHHGLHSNTVALAMGIIVSLLVVVAISFVVYQYVLNKKKPGANNISYKEVDWSQSQDHLADRLDNRL